MSYKYIINAVSRVGDTHQRCDEFFFADTLSSISAGVCNFQNIYTGSKGRKHIFSIASSSDANTSLCDYFLHALFKRDTGKSRTQVSHALKNHTDEIYSIAKKDEDSSMSMLYIDGSYVYASGFNDAHIYHYSQKADIGEKITFSTPTLTEEINISDDKDSPTLPDVACFYKCVGQLKVNDRFLLLGAKLQPLVGDDKALSILKEKRSQACRELVDDAYAKDSSLTLNAVFITVKRNLTPLWVSIGAGLAALAGVLIAIL